MKFKFLFIIALLSVSITVSAQKKGNINIAEEMINIPISSATLFDWLQLIEHNGIILSYNPSMLDLNEKIIIKDRRRSVSRILEKTLSSYDYNIIQPDNEKIIIQIKGRKSLILSGLIKEIGSGEKLYGASISISDSHGKHYFTMTDDRGFYSIKLPKDSYKINISYIGFKPEALTLDLSHDTYQVTKLSLISYPVKEVEVKSRTGANELNEIGPSNLLSFNTSDIFSQIQTLSGIIGSPVNGNFQVNGGSGDENLILLDGVPVYHINHLNAMLSAFNGDAIKNIAFHKSYFPAQFEGRLSSVTDIKLKDGNKEKYIQTLTLDMPAASAVCEGPIIKNKLSYMIGARSSWLDFFDNLSSDDTNMNHSFFDFNSKLSYDINDHTSLHFSAYKTKDNYLYSTELDKKQSILSWNNEIYALQFNSLINKKVTSTTSISYSNYSNKVYAPEIGVAILSYLKGGIRELNFVSNFSTTVNNIFKLSGGFKISHEQFNLASATDSTLDNHKVNINQISLFYSNNIRISDKIFAEGAVNFISYLPQNFQDFFSIQPRFSFKYSPQENHLLYLDFSKMEQFYHYIRVDVIPLPTDFRMPSIRGFKPSTSEHCEVGWKYFMKDCFMETSLYYKRRHKIVALKPGVYPWDGEWDKYIMSGDGQSYGLKLHFFGDWRKFMLQFSYTFSRSFEWFNFYQNRKHVPSLYDIPHIGNLALTYKLNTKSGITIGGNINSGRIIDNYYESDEDIDPIYRKYRRDFNYRLDASYYFSKDFKDIESKLFFRVGLYNIIGNPSQEDYLEFFSVYLKKHCLPYGSITFKF